MALQDDIKEILDILDEKEYSSASSLFTYNQDIEENATIYSKTEEQGPVEGVTWEIQKDYIVIQNGREVLDLERVYKLPLLNDVRRGSELSDSCRIYQKGIMGTVDAELIAKNICILFGVNIDDLKQANRVEYDYIIGCVNKYFDGDLDKNKIPYLTKKSGEDEYLTYIPLDLIYPIGQHLVNKGLFIKTAELTQPLAMSRTPFKDMGIKSKGEFNSLINKTLDEYWGFSFYEYTQEETKNLFTYALNAVELDYSKYLRFVINTAVATTGTYSLKIYEFPSECAYWSNQMGNHFTNTEYSSAGYNETIINITEEPIVYKTYDVRYARSTQKYTNTVTTNTLDPTYYATITTQVNRQFISINNLQTNKLYQVYGKAGINLGNLATNTEVTPQLVKWDDFVNIYPHEHKKFVEIIAGMNIQADDDDLFIVVSDGTATGNQIYFVNRLKKVVVYQIKNNKFTMSSGTLNLNTIGQYQGNFQPVSEEDPSSTTISSGPYAHATKPSSTTVLTFSAPTTIYTYLYDEGAYSNTVREALTFEFNDSAIVSDLTSGYRRSIMWNGGVYTEIKPQNQDGYKLESGATYPDGMTNKEDLATIYPQWWAKKYTAYNPTKSNFNKEELELNGTHAVEWLPVATKKVNTQSTAINPLLSDSDFDRISKDIEELEKDISDDEIEEVPSDNIGDTPETDDAWDLFTVVDGGIKQYWLTDLDQVFKGLFALSPTTLLQNLFGNPIDYIISAQVTYLNLEDIVSDEFVDVSLGPFVLDGHDQGERYPDPVRAQYLLTQYVNLDFGSKNIKQYFTNYHDYISTSCSLYLPFVGFQSIDISEFMGGVMSIKGMCDTFTGSIVYNIICEKNGTKQTLYTFNGNCQVQVPITGANYGRLVGDVLKGATNLAIGTLPATPTTTTSTSIGSSGSTGSSMNRSVNSSNGRMSAHESMTQSANSSNSESASTTTTSSKGGNKPPLINPPQIQVQRSGSVGSNFGVMLSKQPYLVIKRNKSYDPTHLAQLVGEPSNNYVQLGTCSGYTEVKSCHLSGIMATQEEKDEIEALLKNGVIL